jgi:hypothetical protein
MNERKNKTRNKKHGTRIKVRNKKQIMKEEKVKSFILFVPSTI